MIERVDIVGHGRPSTRALADIVADAKRDGPLAPVTVIVPSNFAGLAARRLLASGVVGPGGLANVQFLTPFALAALLAGDRLDGRRPLTNPVLASAVRRSLADDAGPFADVADHLATERALAALYGELSHVSPATLDRLAAAGGAAAEAVRQQRAIATRLAGFAQEDDVAAAAADREDLVGALAPFGHVVWYLPEPTTPAIARFLACVLRAAPAAAVIGLTGDADADAAIVATCRSVGVALPEDAGSQLEVALGSRIVSVSDADEEVRAVVRRIAELAEDGVPLDRIGVFHPTADPYIRTLRQQLAAAGIPANGPAQERLADSAAGRTLLAALDLPGERWRRDRVMALVAGAPVRHAGRPARPARWEAASRRAGVVQDLTDWHRKLDSLRRRLDEQAADLDPEADAVRAGHLQRQRADAVDLGTFVEAVSGAVGAVDRAPTWSAKAAAGHALLGLLLGGGNDRQRWPEAEQAAFDAVDEALTRLAALDELEPGPTPEVFRRALSAELDVRRGRSGRFGHGVVYGPLSGAVGQDLDAVFVVGLTEGTCPAPRRDDAMLPEAARALAAGELALRADALHDQHRWFLAALAAAPAERRWLLHPRGDLRGGRHRLPSRWLLPTASALAGHTVYSTDFRRLDAPVVEVVPSFVAGLRSAPVAGSAAERDLAVVARHLHDGGSPDDHPVTATVARGLQGHGSRRSPRFTEWDGNLAGVPVPSPATGEVLSATRLQRWAGCGFRYLLHDVLGLGDREDPERIVELSALQRGSLIHEVLERFFAEVIEAGPPDPDEPWTDEHRRRIHAIAHDVCAEYEREGVTGRPVRWRLQQDDLFALLDSFLTADEGFRAANRTRPARVELAFGFDEADPVVVELGDGRRVRFRGAADRVDVTDEGHHLVLDYKTGKGKGYTGLDQDPVQAGTTLQLAVYSEAARQLLGATSAAGHYWVLNDQSCDDLPGYDWTAERSQRFVEVVEAIVDGIETGVFAAQPGEFQTWDQRHENCRHCEFDRLCPVDRSEQAAAKAGATELQVRRRLQPAVPDGDHDEEEARP